MIDCGNDNQAQDIGATILFWVACLVMGVMVWGAITFTAWVFDDGIHPEGRSGIESYDYGLEYEEEER